MTFITIKVIYMCEDLTLSQRRKMKLNRILILSITMLAACSDRTLNEADSVITEVHLQSGFFGQVTIWVDDEQVYDSAISSQAPLSAPQGKFTLSLNRGIANIKVSWGSAGALLTDDSSVQIGSFEVYFLGISIVDDAISIKLQASEFHY